MKKNTDLGLLILRLALGILMLLHGIGKLNGLGFIQNVLTEKGLPSFFAYGVWIGELVAPLAILIGFRTRIAAAIFAFNCLTAALLVHANDIFALNQHGGWGVELLGLYFFGALALLFTGGGKYAVSKHNRWD